MSPGDIPRRGVLGKMIFSFIGFPMDYSGGPFSSSSSSNQQQFECSLHSVIEWYVHIPQSCFACFEVQKKVCFLEEINAYIVNTHLRPKHYQHVPGEHYTFVLVIHFLPHVIQNITYILISLKMYYHVFLFDD